MTSTSLQERWQNQGYLNFLKIIEGLLFVKDGIGAFCNDIMSRFQSEMLTKHNIEKKDCIKSTCKAKNIKQGKLQPECPNICSVMLKDILSEHISKKQPNSIYWENSQIHKWPSDAWEIAKVYMGRGQKLHNNGPQKSDSAAIFQLLKSCNRFSKFVTIKEANELSERRNKMMHCSSLSVDEEQTTKDLNVMIKFLKDLIPKLSANNISKEPLEEAVEKLTQLLSTDFEIFLKNNQKSTEEEEIMILREMINDHESRLTNIEEISDKLEEVKAVIPLLSMLRNNPDLMGKLDVGFDNLLSLSQLDDRTTALEAEQTLTTSRVSDVEEVIMKLQKQLNSFTSTDKTRPQVTNYKGKLKNFLDSKKFAGTPNYKAWPDPGSSDNWMASVTLILKSEMKTFKCSTSCKRVIDAEHSAASVAFQFLNDNPETFVVNEDVSTASSDKSVAKLDEMLHSYGFPTATYSQYTEKFNGSIKQFAISVFVSVNGIFQKKFSDNCMKQTEMELAAAKEAVAVFCENEGGGNAKDVLYRWCGKKHSIPKYVNFPSSIPIRYVHIISSAFTENCTVEMNSEFCNRKKDAKQNAAELLLKLFSETGLSEVWSTRDQVKSEGHQAEVGISSQQVDNSQDNMNETLQDFSISEKKADLVDLDNFDASPNCKKLKDLCVQLQLESPQFHITNTENQFQVNVSMYYVFGSTKLCKNKAEAETEAAKEALAVLSILDTIPEQDKPAKSVLNELYQKKKIVLSQPEYSIDGSAESFSSKVKIRFAVSFAEIFKTDLEAREIVAKKILQAFGYGENYYAVLKDKCIQLNVKRPIERNAEKQFRAVLDMTYTFDPKALYPSKKEAEKNAACFVLKIIYPHIDHSDLNKCKNSLQERTPKVPVIYTCIPAENGQFMATVTVSFEYEGDKWHRDEKDAIDEVAEKFIKKLSIQ